MKLALGIILAAIVATPAQGQEYPYRARSYDNARPEYRADRYSYDRRDGYYREDEGYYRDRPRRMCRNSGTTGAIVGGALGMLLGRAIDTRGERATGTIIGGAAGALLGREVDRDCEGYRYRR